MCNMKNHVARHNGKILSNEKKPEPNKKKKRKNKNKKNNSDNCNCQDDPELEIQEDCPLNENCLEKGIVYQADVFPANATEQTKPLKIYYGQSENTFKKRWTGHRYNFNHRDSDHTTLSTYVWKCRDEGFEPTIKWSIKKTGYPFSSGSKKCDLCITEKTVILYANKSNMLNRRDELMEKCRHKKKFTLKKCEVELGPYDPP